MPSIQILDEITSSQIAAGEVVERPVSVVKELVENSIDAGATAINIQIQDGGLSLIVINDNGCGMDELDAALAFQRHATSKINKLDDLGRINSMGFRGEALPSIAAVGRVELKTRVWDGVKGVLIEVSGGELLDQRHVGCPAGTTVTVRDLFYNTPARRKHMKAAATEAGLISDLVNRLAVIRPDIGFSLSHNGRGVFKSPGTGKLLDALVAVYGTNLVKQLLPVNSDKGFLRVKGYTSNPGLHRSSRQYITVAVNGRLIKSKLILQAIRDSYHTLLPGGRYPVAVLLLELEKDLIDINVHPSKMEIKILREQEVAALISGVLRATLLSKPLIPEIADVNVKGGGDLEPVQEELNFSRAKEVDDRPRTFAGGQIDEYVDTGHTNSPPVIKDDTVKETGGNYKSGPDIFLNLHPLGYLPPTYIVAAGEEGLYIIDQHAAHERILYESFTASMSSGTDSSQLLLMPITLDFTCRDINVILEHLPLFNSMGFMLEEFGSKTLVLRGVPAGFPLGEEVVFFDDIVEYLSLPGRTPSREDLVHRMSSSAACRAAVKSGSRVSENAARSLLEQLSQTTNPYTCPHGRPTVIHLSTRELALRFKRV